MRNILYSKSQKDISKENFCLIQKDEDLCIQQQKSVKAFAGSSQRKYCLLCRNVLSETMSAFEHRNILYVTCEECNHIQTKLNLPQGYPYTQKEVSFDKIYPKLNKNDYKSRQERIYNPKLDWIIKSLTEIGFHESELFSLKWVELGSGLGYFLSALIGKGIRNLTGIEENSNLVNAANDILQNNFVVCSKKPLAQSIKDYEADIYVAFFVIEHVDEVYEFFTALKDKPKNTILVFSVPVFGFSCLIENVFEQNYARNLDNVIHTQMYTDKSIDFAMKYADYTITNEWIFGQDSSDLVRCFYDRLKYKYPKQMLDQIMENLTELQDPFQACLDQLKLSDQRHIIAIKN